VRDEYILQNVIQQILDSRFRGNDDKELKLDVPKWNIKNLSERTMKDIIPVENIHKAIYLIRGQKVMLSTDLAILYGVAPKVLIQSVKRNRERFPRDFMYQIDAQSFTILKSQIVTSSWGGSRSRPYAFTEQGVAMLSSVLNSPRAIQVNIAIMRAFVNLRHSLATNTKLAAKLRAMEEKYDGQFREVFEVLRELMEPPELPAKKIGFQVKEHAAKYRAARRKKR